MSRGFWAGVMLFSLAITAGAGWYVMTEIQKKNTVELPLRKIEPVKTEVAKPEPAKPAPAAVKEESTSTPPAASEDAGNKRRILFTYRNSTAKTVYLIGEFNNWFRKPMTKSDKAWTATAEIAPGTYKYKFVVDDKRVRDPNNKNVSSDGNSVITVKPLDAQ